MDVLTHTVALDGSSPSTTYLVAPCRMVLLGGYCISNTEITTIDLTVVNGSTTQLTFDLAATSAAAVCEADVTNTTIFEAGDAIKIVCPDGGTATEIGFVLKYDPTLSGVAGA